MAEWIKSKYKGLRYREHLTKTTGVGRAKRPLRYYMMTFKIDGKTISVSLGWEGDYIKNEEHAQRINQQLQRQRARPQFRRCRDDCCRAQLGRAERSGADGQTGELRHRRVEPGFFGLGPVPAVQQALSRSDWVVFNEAFAAIALACLRELGFAEDVVNVEGGAIAHGHPIGASGAILAIRLMHSMKRDGCRRGVSRFA